MTACEMDILNDLLKIALDGYFCTDWEERQKNIAFRYCRLWGKDRIKPILKKVNYKIKRKYKVKKDAYIIE